MSDAAWVVVVRPTAQAPDKPMSRRPDTTSRRIQVFAAHLPPDHSRPVHLTVFVPDAVNDCAQDLVVLCPRRAPPRIPLLSFVPEVRGRGDRQHAADRLDPKLFPMIVTERDHHFARRSSSAYARS